VHESRAARGVETVRAALADRDAAAFVHAGADADAALFGCDAVVVTPAHAIGLVAADGDRAEDGDGAAAENADGAAARGADAPLAVRRVDDPVGSVARVLGEHAGGSEGTVLTPRSVRHDAALFVERAGFAVASTTALAEGRAVKTPAERDALRGVGAATTAAADAVGTWLAGGGASDERRRERDGTGEGRDGDDHVDAGREVEGEGGVAAGAVAEGVRRVVGVELARRGVGAGDVRVDGPEPFDPDRPVVVDCRPRGPAGSRLRAAWTVVVDGDGGWERRAHVALRAAHRAGRERLAAALDGGRETAGSVAAEVRAELAAYGFDDPTVAVHGVGLDTREAPRGGDPIEAGQALVVAASVTRAADRTASATRRRERVALAETLLVGEEVERLVALPSSLSPSR
jgi:Xaa-Pro aminopeptidase